MAVVAPPVAVALARDIRTVPGPDPRLVYEAKWDGWRCVAFTQSQHLQSRAGKDLSARFPEITRAAASLPDVVLDGELVALTNEGRLDFLALQTSPGARRAGGVRIYFVVFDLLATARTDWRPRPYQARRKRLEQLLDRVPPPLQLAPMTRDRDQALRWMDPLFGQAGIEGCVSKRVDAPYRAGRGSDAWIKTRQKVTLDALILGFTGPLGHPDALVLGQAGPRGELRAVGLSLPISGPLRAALAGRLRPVGSREELPGVLGGLPGQAGVAYQPVTPSAVVEVEADLNVEFDRFRHRPRATRFRADLAT